MRVAELGEFNLIDRLASLIVKNNDQRAASHKDLLIGIGDDAAAWKCRAGVELITTDILVEGTHFDFSYMRWRDLGWKSIAINISDIYAMGGRPQYALVSLALPGHHKVSSVLEMYLGLIEICNKYGIVIIGGNVSASEKVTVNVTLTGTVGKKIIKRSAARAGDLISVFGHPGLSAAGLHVLKSNLNVSTRAQMLFHKAHVHPTPKFDSGHDLAACGVQAAIDISDGLLSDLEHICKASGVGAIIYEQNLPLHPLLKRYFKDNYLEFVLTGGEDYELLFTADCDTMDTVQKKIKPAPAIIGEIVDYKPGKVIIMDALGKKIKHSRKGWDHYKRPNINE